MFPLSAILKKPDTRRRFAAALLLMVMAVHGTAEGALLSYLHYEMNRSGGGAACCGAPATADGAEPASCCSDESAPDEDAEADDAETETVASCCSEKPAPAVCAPPATPKHECPCTANGGTCKMGDACRCGKERIAPPLGTFFFELPGCHTTAPGHDNLLLPMSVQIHVTFTPADAASAIIARSVCPQFIEIAWPQVYLPPATPPPRHRG